VVQPKQISLHDQLAGRQPRRAAGAAACGGVEVIQGPESHENGKFAWIMDTDENKVELWEPKVWDDKKQRCLRVPAHRGSLSGFGGGPKMCRAKLPREMRRSHIRGVVARTCETDHFVR
jgi:hypothetical protein